MVNFTAANARLSTGLGHMLLAIALLIPALDAGADNAVADRVLAAYNALDGYCDTIKVLDVDGLHPSELHRCYTRDGRYKRSELSKPSYYRKVEWGDAEHEYFLSKGGDDSDTYYSEQTARSSRGGGPPDGLAARAISAFLRNVTSENSARDILRGMEVIEDGPESTVLQRRDKTSASVDVVERVWVRKADGFVVRAEQTMGGRSLFSATLAEARANPPLSQADLNETVPFFSYYSLKTHPGLFTFGVAMASFVAGLVLSILWRRPRNWQHNWHLYKKGFIAAIKSLPVILLLALVPATFLFAMFLSICEALAAVALAALMLGTQLGDLIRTGQLGTGPSA